MRTKPKIPNAITRAASTVRRAISRITHRRDHEDVAPQPVPRFSAEPERARPKKIQSDIALDSLGGYMPTQTSLKSSFRATGADQQRDQEFALGVTDERWNDEDRFTNKSGNPRIGTHGRTYEPEERKAK